MTVETAVRTQLASHSGLAALVGDRIQPLPVSQYTDLPAVTYQRISTTATLHRGGTRHYRSRFQIDGWAESYEGMIALRTQIRAAMTGFRQADYPRVDMALLQDDRDIREEETSRWRCVIDYFVFHEEG